MAEFLVKVADEQGICAAGGARLFRSRSARPVRAAGVPGFTGLKPRTLLSASGASLGGRASCAGTFLISSAVFDPHQSRPAHPDLARSSDQAAARQVAAEATGKRARACQRRRVAVGRFCGAAGVSEDVHDTLLAGEKSGNMEEVLGRYITYQRMVQTFRKKLLVSLVYPALLSRW